MRQAFLGVLTLIFGSLAAATIPWDAPGPIPDPDYPISLNSLAVRKVTGYCQTSCFIPIADPFCGSVTGSPYCQLRQFSPPPFNSIGPDPDCTDPNTQFIHDSDNGAPYPLTNIQVSHFWCEQYCLALGSCYAYAVQPPTSDFFGSCLYYFEENQFDAQCLSFQGNAELGWSQYDYTTYFLKCPWARQSGFIGAVPDSDYCKWSSATNTVACYGSLTAGTPPQQYAPQTVDQCAQLCERAANVGFPSQCNAWSYSSVVGCELYAYGGAAPFALSSPPSSDSTFGYNAMQCETAPSAVSVPTVTPAPPSTPEPTTAVPPTPEPTTGVPPTPEPTTAVPPTPEPTTAVPPTPEPTTAVPPTPEPTTGTTAVPPTPEPTTAVPPTPEPTTAVPPTPQPTTAVPPTPQPTTGVPPTPRPTTSVPPTPQPTTARPPTPVPPTPVPTTARPPTPAPTTTRAPTTRRPRTPAPTTARPPTPAPTTARPPTPAPTTRRPPTPVPSTARPPTPAPIPVLCTPSSGTCTAASCEDYGWSTYGPKCSQCSTYSAEHGFSAEWYDDDDDYWGSNSHSNSNSRSNSRSNSNSHSDSESRSQSGPQSGCGKTRCVPVNPSCLSQLRSVKWCLGSISCPSGKCGSFRSGDKCIITDYPGKKDNFRVCRYP